MQEPARQPFTPLDVAQAICSIACVGLAMLSIAASAKQHSVYSVNPSDSYHEILELRGDSWLGVAREINPVVLLLTISAFAASVALAAACCDRYHCIAGVISGVATLTAGIAWGALPPPV